MLTVEDINILGQLLNTSMGVSSLVTPTVSIKCYLYGSDPNKMCVDFTTVVTFASEGSLREQKKTFENESVQLTDAKIKELKKEFKSAAGRALKTKLVETDDSIEIINASPHTPRKTAYYRRKSIFEVQ
jgi:hypothetical protein